VDHAHHVVDVGEAGVAAEGVGEEVLDDAISWAESVIERRRESTREKNVSIDTKTARRRRSLRAPAGRVKASSDLEAKEHASCRLPIITRRLVRLTGENL